MQLSYIDMRNQYINVPIVDITKWHIQKIATENKYKNNLIQYKKNRQNVTSNILDVSYFDVDMQDKYFYIQLINVDM